MVRYALMTVLACATTFALALPNPQLTPDPSGDKNIGNGAGGQFITGACLSDADCQSGCCAVLGSGGICSGPAVSTAQGKQGCGFNGGGGGAPPPTEDAPPATDNSGAGSGAIDTSIPGAENVGLGSGAQFITGQCFSDADCASGCCAGVTGKTTAQCSGPDVSFDSGKTGCGFGA